MDSMDIFPSGSLPRSRAKPGPGLGTRRAPRASTHGQRGPGAGGGGASGRADDGRRAFIRGRSGGGSAAVQTPAASSPLPLPASPGETRPGPGDRVSAPPGAGCGPRRSSFRRPCSLPAPLAPAARAGAGPARGSREGSRAPSRPLAPHLGRRRRRVHDRDPPAEDTRRRRRAPGRPPPAPPVPALCRPPPAPAERDRTDFDVRMAVTLEEAPWLGWILVKALVRFAFMVANNLVAIPSYLCYIIVLLPLRLLDSKRYWYLEGMMYKWLLGMVASWGWYAGYTVMEWGEDVKAISEDEAVMLVNHQATGDVCTLMMCLQDKGLVVAQMMWLMDHIFKYTNFGIVSLIHGDFFIRQGKSHRDQQLLLLKKHLENNYRSRDRKWIVLFPEGGFLRKRREISQSFAKKNNLPFLTHVTLPRVGATKIILRALVARQENGSPAGGDAKELDNKSKGLQWIIDTTIAYPKAEPIDIQTWILGYRKPAVTHVHYRIFPVKDVPLETDDLSDWLYQRFIEKEDLLSHFYETGAFPPPKGRKEAVSREMTLSNMWILLIQSFAFLSGYMWYSIFQYFYHCLF